MAIKINDPLLKALKDSMSSEWDPSSEFTPDDLTTDDLKSYLDEGGDIITEEPGDTRSPFSDPEKEYMMQAIERLQNERGAMPYGPGGFGAPIEELPSLPQKAIPVQEINDVNRQLLDEALNTGIKSAPKTGNKRYKEEPESGSTLGPGYKNYKRKQKKEKK